MFIKLTRTDGKVSALFIGEVNDETFIALRSDGEELEVKIKETPEQIIAMIKEQAQ